MVAGLDDPPGVVVVAHVATPGERLVGDPDTARGGALGELAQLRRGQRVVVDRVLADVGADQHEVGAELLHHRELGLRAPQVRREALLGHRLEVAQRLEQRDLQPERLAARRTTSAACPATRSGRARTARPRRSPPPPRRQLVLERAAQADGRDRVAHGARHPPLHPSFGDPPRPDITYQSVHCFERVLGEEAAVEHHARTRRARTRRPGQDTEEGGARQLGRQRARVLRLLHLRDGRGARLRQGLLPRVRPRDRHAAVARDLRRRLRGAARSARSSWATSATSTGASASCC